MNDSPRVSVSMDTDPRNTTIKVGDVNLLCTTVEIFQEAGRPPRLTATLVPGRFRGVFGEAGFLLRHPTSGDEKLVSRIEFADGTTWEAPTCNA